MKKSRNRSIFQMGLIFVLCLLSAPIWGKPVPVNQEKVDQVANGTLTEAFASWWGFDEEDSTENLQAALDSGVKKLTIDKMDSEWLVRPLFVPSNIEIVLADDVTVRAKPGEFHGMEDSLITIASQKNVILRGSKNSVLLMNKKDYHSSAYKKSQFRAGVLLVGSKNVRIENLTIRSTGGDGITIGCDPKRLPLWISCEDIVIRNVFCDDNNRQGISACSVKNLLIEDCNLSNTWGEQPKSGIDFEPSVQDECLINCVMRRCIMENNRGFGIVVSIRNLNACSRPFSLVIEDCVCRHNWYGMGYLAGNGEKLSLDGKLTVRNCRLENNLEHDLLIDEKGINGPIGLFENCIIDSTEKSPRNKPSPIAIISRKSNQYPAGNLIFKNITLIDPEKRPPLIYTDQTEIGLGMQEISGDITIKAGANDAGMTLESSHPEKMKPVSEKINPALKSENLLSVPRIHHRGLWHFYVQKDQTFTFAMQQFQHRSSEMKPITPVLTAPDGRIQNLDSFNETKKTYEIKADQTGTWTLDADAGPNSFTVTDVSVPNACSYYPLLNLTQTTGTFYFYVPKKTHQFSLRFVTYEGSRQTTTIFDPSGQKVWCNEDFTPVAKTFETEENPASGIWAVKFGKQNDMDKVTAFRILFCGITPMLSPDPDRILTETTAK